MSQLGFCKSTTVAQSDNPPLTFATAGATRRTSIEGRVETLTGGSDGTLKGYGEFRLIDRIRQKAGDLSHPEVGIGDDAAVLSLGERTLLTTDAFVEGVHFDPAIGSWCQIGARMVTAAVSDIAAMGGSPRHVVASLCAPQDFSVSAFDSLADGLIGACRSYGAVLVGGDTVRSTGPVMVSLAVTGSVDGSPILRSGARVGDIIAVTGRLGGSLAGLLVLKDKTLAGKFLGAVGRHLEPRARVEEGKILASSGLVTSMIDISDGLSSDVHHLAESSGVGIAIDAERIPMMESVDQISANLGKKTLEVILQSGEEFELLFTLSSKDPQGIDRVLEHVGERTKTEITRIGEVRPSAEEVTLAFADGTSRSLPPQGYDHF